MNGSQPVKLDWNLVQYFLAVVDHGAVARAAEATGVSQPTLSRQIAALEAAIGAALFTRSTRGSMLTDIGEALVGPAREMQEAAHKLHLAIKGQSQSLVDTVRISASEMVCVYLLPPILGELRKSHPDIQIEVLANNAQDNLLEGGADIAVRMVQPNQDTLVARNLGGLKLGAYATRGYMQNKGSELSTHNSAAFDWIGYDKNDVILHGLRQLGMPMTRESFALRSDSDIVRWHALLEGLGIGFEFEVLAQRHPELVRVMPPDAIPSIPVWLTAPQELRSNPRIRVVFDHLADQLSQLTNRARE